jgi:hypothetical protein
LIDPHHDSPNFDGRKPGTRLQEAMETRIVPSVRPFELTPGQVKREFHALLDAGARLLPRGEARSDPPSL